MVAVALASGSVALDASGRESTRTLFVLVSVRPAAWAGCTSTALLGWNGVTTTVLVGDVDCSSTSRSPVLVPVSRFRFCFDRRQMQKAPRKPRTRSPAAVEPTAIPICAPVLSVENESLPSVTACSRGTHKRLILYCSSPSFHHPPRTPDCERMYSTAIPQSPVLPP